jgi:hypothetical protein
MSLRLERKFVVNRCHGGFGISAAAAHRLAEIKGWRVRSDNCEGWEFLRGGGEWRPLSDVIGRDDKDLVSIVEEMGRAADGPYARLEVVEAYAVVSITSYDGRETAQVTASGVF